MVLKVTLSTNRGASGRWWSSRVRSIFRVRFAPAAHGIKSGFGTEHTREDTNSAKGMEVTREVLAVEIGGTKLQAAVGRGGASPLQSLRRLHIDRAAGAEGILSQLEPLLKQITAEHQVEAVSIGFGGPVDADSGRVITSHQVAGWDQFELAEWCRRIVPVPAILANDCDVAALAEARCGAGAGSARVFYVTVGTGIGGGWVIDGRLQGTGCPAIAEIGHLIPDRSQPGQTVEWWASGAGIEQRAAQALDQPAGRSLSVPEIAAAARSGDATAGCVLSEAWEVLGWAIAQMLTLLAAQRVVIGGGVAMLGERQFFEPVRQAVRQSVFAPLADSYQIVPSQLGQEVVLHGAVEKGLDLFN